MTIELPQSDWLISRSSCKPLITTRETTTVHSTSMTLEHTWLTCILKERPLLMIRNMLTSLAVSFTSVFQRYTLASPTPAAMQVAWQANLTEWTSPDITGNLYSSPSKTIKQTVNSYLFTPTVSGRTLHALAVSHTITWRSREHEATMLVWHGECATHHTTSVCPTSERVLSHPTRSHSLTVRSQELVAYIATNPLKNSLLEDACTVTEYSDQCSAICWEAGWHHRSSMFFENTKKWFGGIPEVPQTCCIIPWTRC